MSLSAQNRKAVWEEHKDSLRRLQSRVSETRTPPRYSPQRGTPPNKYSPQKGIQPSRYSPNRSPVEAGRRSHSPYGKYRKATSPAYLNRIETPTEHDRRRNKGGLRGNKYGIIPPVQNRSHQTPDYDSWGEDSEDDSGDEQNYSYMPQPYPYPAYGYPAYQPPPPGQPPPQVVFGAPFPIYYPPPPQYGYRNKRARDKRAKRTQPNVHQSQPQAGRTSRHHKNSKVHHSMPLHNGYRHDDRSHRHRDEMFDSDRNDVLKRYKYIETQPSPYTPENIDDVVARKYQDEPDLLSLFYYNDHPLFAEDFVTWFVNDCLEEIIPDTLIETLTDINKLGSPHFRVIGRHDVSFLGQQGEVKEHVGEPKSYPYNDHAAQLMTAQILEEVVPELTHDVVKLAMAELVGDYMGFASNIPIEDRVNELVKEANALGGLDVSDTMNSVLEDLLDDHIAEIQQEVINDVVTDVVVEDIIEDLVEQEVDDEAPVVAQEVLSQYDSKIERRELKEVAKQAGDKLQESIMLDYILSLIASQGRVWSESDHANKYLDDLLLDLLIEQFYLVKEHKEKTIENNPLRKLHEKVTTDVAVDLLLQQLTASLDEDLADVDEYERGVDGSHNTIKTPLIPKTTQKFSR